MWQSERNFTEEQRRAYWEEMVARAERDASVRGEPHVIFRLGVTTLALEAGACRGVVPYTAPAPLPTLPRYILGVAAIRGKPTSVTDLGALLGIHAHSRTGHLLLVHHGGEETAMKVDWVDVVKKLDTSAMSPPSDELGGLRSGLVLGLSDPGGEPIIVLDAKRCLRAGDGI